MSAVKSRKNIEISIRYSKAVFHAEEKRRQEIGGEEEGREGCEAEARGLATPPDSAAEVANFLAKTGRVQQDFSNGLVAHQLSRP